MSVTPTGLVTPTVEEIRAEIVADLLANVDPALDLSANQPLGQIVGIFAAKLANAYELVTVAYNAFNPAASEGFALETVSAITGTVRQAATRSRVLCTVNLNVGFTALAGTMFGHIAGYPDVLFRNEAAIGPVGSTGDYPLWFEAVDFGPIVANAGTLEEIATPLSGWNSITNADDAALGLEEDTDEALRLRRLEELAAGGGSTPDAVRADVLQVEGVEQAYVFENYSDVEVDGIPSKAIEVLVYDGLIPAAANADIRAAIWKNKGSGVQTHGAVTGTTPDSEGVDRIVNFSRSTQKPLYLQYTITVDPAIYPSNGADLVKAAAAARVAATQGLGSDVIALAYRAEALTVPGVVDVTDFRLGFTASPSGIANLSISSREIATLDTSDVTVALG
jgi:uncharacterized phage protein gp47/JayE